MDHSLRICVILPFAYLCFYSGTSCAQSNAKAKEAFNKGYFEKSVVLYQKEFQKTTKENTSYNSLLYNMAEAYRLSGNYRMADSLHAQVDYSKASYWGYALTLLQQYRADKCLKYAKYNLKFDALQSELNQIVTACALFKAKVEESNVIIKTIPLPQKKERLIIPGFIIGKQDEKEVVERFNEYAYKRKDIDKSDNYPINLSGISLKGKTAMNFSVANPEKAGFSISPDHFTYFYNPAYYRLYKASSKSKTIFESGTKLPDGLKSLGHHKEFPVCGHKEIIKQAWVSSDKNVMIFSTNKLKGEGGYDLYMSTLSSDGWTKPVNLGSRINTSYNEISPFISPNGMLYFSSNGREGHGGYDIYSFDLSRMDSSETENLPKPFNSAFDDYSFLYHEQSGFGVFASTRPNGIFSKQLFSFENKVVNCDAHLVFQVYPEITARNANPKYCINFDKLSLQDSLPKNRVYAWMMGDGKKNKGLKFSYCYTKSGFYKAKLLIYNPSKKTTDTTKITQDIVVAEKDFLRMEYATKGKLAEFTTTSSVCKKCDNVNYYWDFGDDTFGCGFAVKHSYKTFGAYNVRLIMHFKKEKTERSFSCYDRIIIEELL